jgi:hypothetical protein
VRHSELEKQAHVDQSDPLPPATLSPSLHNSKTCLASNRSGTQDIRRIWLLLKTATLPPSIQSATADAAVGDLGSILVRILEAQSKANLRLHQSLMENFRVTSAAVGATGTTRDAQLLNAKLRILQACAGHNDGGPFVPSKLYLEVDWDGGTTDTFSRVLHCLVVMVPGSLTCAMCISRRRLCWRRRRSTSQSTRI